MSNPEETYVLTDRDRACFSCRLPDCRPRHPACAFWTLHSAPPADAPVVAGPSGRKGTLCGLTRALFQAGWTQADIAQRTGAPRYRVSKVCQGTKRDPDIEAAIASAIGLPVEQIFNTNERTANP